MGRHGMRDTAFLSARRFGAAASQERLFRGRNQRAGARTEVGEPITLVDGDYFPP